MWVRVRAGTHEGGKGKISAQGMRGQGRAQDSMWFVLHVELIDSLFQFFPLLLIRGLQHSITLSEA